MSGIIGQSSFGYTPLVLKLVLNCRSSVACCLLFRAMLQEQAENCFIHGVVYVLCQISHLNWMIVGKLAKDHGSNTRNVVEQYRLSVGVPHKIYL